MTRLLALSPPSRIGKGAGGLGFSNLSALKTFAGGGRSEAV